MIVRWLGAGFSHVTARPVIVAAFKQAVGREPNQNEAQIVQAVAWGESNYGAGWKGHSGTNNWGAVQAGKPPCNPETSFLYTDTHPTASGSVPYQICFRKYPTPEAGAAHFIQIMYKMPGVAAAAKEGDIKGVSTAMYNGGYYEGFGASKEARIANHTKMLTANVQRIAKANNESMPSPPKSDIFTLRNLLIAGAVGAVGWGVYKRKKR